ncbi:MAG: hypothetical protein ACFE9L_16145 [Candidatus Hodarchaeota archaeon]
MNYEPKYIRMSYTPDVKVKNARKETGLLILIIFFVITFAV